jgi:hypothetical protein
MHAMCACLSTACCHVQPPRVLANLHCCSSAAAVVTAGCAASEFRQGCFTCTGTSHPAVRQFSLPHLPSGTFHCNRSTVPCP